MRKDRFKSHFDYFISSPALLISLVVLALFRPSFAFGNTLAETRGFGTRAISMGGAFTAVADDVSALYYNPAGLAQINDHHFYFEYLLVLPRVYLQRGSGSKEIMLDKETKAPMLAFILDLSKPLKLPRKLVFGWAGYFPDNFKSVAKFRYGTDHFDPYYPLYGDSHEEQSLGIWAGGGFEVFPWLMIGGGISFAFHAKRGWADVAFTLRLEPVKEQGRITLDVTTEIFPLVGILLKPTPRLRFGFTWRRYGQVMLGEGGRLDLKGNLSLGPDLKIPIPLAIPIPAYTHYRPTQYAFGASYQFLDELLLAVDLTYYDWRPYQDNVIRTPEPPMKEIIVPRVGMEYSLQKELALRMGYSFQKSPLPQQRSGYHTNFLDNDVHALSFGFGYLWQIMGFPKKPAELSCFYQIHILVPRTFQNVHSGEEDLRSMGVFHSFGFGLRFHL